MSRIHNAALTAILGTALLGATAITPSFAEETKNDIHEDGMMSGESMSTDMSDGMTAHDNMSKNGMTTETMSDDHMSGDDMTDEDMMSDDHMSDEKMMDGDHMSGDGKM